MSYGRFLGIGVGPGAEDLLTLRAVRLLREVDAIVFPKGSESAASVAWDIAAGAVGEVPGQERLGLLFPMTKDPAILREAWDQAFAQIGVRLESGRSVAFITEGDPMVFSTFGYLCQEAQARWPGITVEIVPGISSITAVAAALAEPLADSDQRIAILPATYGLEDLPAVLGSFDTTVLMKAAGVMPDLVRILEAEGQLGGASYVARVTSGRQRVVKDLRDLLGERPDYLSTVVVHRQPAPRPRGPRRPYALYALTGGGLEAARLLAGELGESQIFVGARLQDVAPPGALPLTSPLATTIQDHFGAFGCHVFFLSVGAAVRLIAPLLGDKRTDPAVICVDEARRFVVPILSGHFGGANAHAETIAEILGATAVVTTASDAIGTLPVDILGREFGWRLADPVRNTLQAAAALVGGGPVGFIQETGEPDWWPLDRPLPPGVRCARNCDEIDPADHEALLIVSDRLLERLRPEHWAKAVVYRPRSLVLGIGCDRQTPYDLIDRGVRQFLSEAGLAIESVRTLATIDLKADEPALLGLARSHGWELQVYPAAQLASLPVPNPSARVEHHVGSPGVAEPAALLAAGARELVMTKKKYTEPGANRSMTLAVARIPFPSREAAAAAGEV